MLEVQLQQQQDAAKQASESRRQRDSDKVVSLERQVSVGVICSEQTTTNNSNISYRCTWCVLINMYYVYSW